MIASVSLDMDNKWSYLKTHGDSEWQSLPTYFPELVPLVLEELERLGISITFFVVGQDAARDENVPFLQQIPKAGHNVGNHSFHHEPWLHTYSEDELTRELSDAEDSIASATGVRPLGFRGPGYSWSTSLLRILASRGYIYDASTLPTFIGPLARMYYFWTSHFSKEDREQRKQLFGSVADALRPIRPYHWYSDSEPIGLLEIPVTTMPLLRVPFHLSYLLFLSRRSVLLAMSYLRLALGLSRLAGLGPSFLLHPLDLLGRDRVADLGFFPGMDLLTEEKIRLFRMVIGALKDQFVLGTMEDHARAILSVAMDHSR